MIFAVILCFLYYQYSPDDGGYAYLGSGGYGVGGVAAGIEFLDAAVEADLYLAGAVGGYAHIYLAYFADGVVDVEGSVAFQPHHLAEQEQEYRDEGAACQYADKSQKVLVFYGPVEADSAPAEAEHEIYYVPDAEKVHGSAVVEGVASAVSVEADVDVAGVACIAYADEAEGHLHDEHYAGENGYHPIHLHEGCLGLKICVKFLYHTAFDFVEDKDI